MDYVLTIIAIVLALLLIGFFSGIELAFVSANKLTIELRKKQGNFAGKTWSGYNDKPAQFIGTTLVALNVFIVIYGLLSSELLKNAFWDRFNITNPYLRLTIETVVTTFFLLIVEALFKAIFKAKSASILGSAVLTYITHFFYSIFVNIAKFFVNIAEWLLKYLFNVKITEKKEAFSKTDLEYFVQQHNVDDEDTSNVELNQELFENALQLSDTKIRACLIPRKEIIAVPHTANITDVHNKFIETKLSKLIVYEDSIDNIIGYVHQLDLFKKPSTINEILLPIFTVPESMSAADVLAAFTKHRKSIAWVIDEFGGTAGIVTMEDVLEEIFGDIQDEYDTDEFIEKQLSATEFIFSGRIEIDYIAEKYQLDFDGGDQEAGTLSGYIINNHEGIPKQKERIIINNYQFDILSVGPTRIETIKLKKLK
jgi:putative hemolysin